MDKGVVVSPLVKYIDLNIRICRPVGLKPEDLAIVLDHVIARIGLQYDRRNFWDLTRYMLPFQMIPPGLREDALHFGSGRETETICSSLLAEAFGRVRFPILPGPRAPQARAPSASGCASRSWGARRGARTAACSGRAIRRSACRATSTSRPISRSSSSTPREARRVRLPAARVGERARAERVYGRLSPRAE